MKKYKEFTESVIVENYDLRGELSNRLRILSERVKDIVIVDADSDGYNSKRAKEEVSILNTIKWDIIKVESKVKTAENKLGFYR